MKRRKISTMDAADGPVLPRATRDEAEPVEREVRLVRKRGMLVAIPVEDIEALRSETVRQTTASLRNRQR